MVEGYSEIEDLYQSGIEIYALSDQPTTCGHCGSRTEFNDITDNVQIHKCLNGLCGYSFITEADEEDD